MKEITDAPACEYANELISFVYSELSNRESQEFKLHLNTCSHCSMELDSFGEMRDAIGAWKYQSLAGVALAEEASQVSNVRKKSAVAALREFFHLSPRWMKGAVGLATVLFCIFAVLATARLNLKAPIEPPGPIAKTYTQQEVDELLAKARAESLSITTAPTIASSSEAPKPVQEIPKRRAEVPKHTQSKRPLSKSEREQLAADLRLATAGTDDTFHLIGDRINE